MKRIFSLIMCAVILVSVFRQQAGALSADGTPMISVCDAECEAGESVTVSIDIINNPGIMYLEITPKFDEALGAPTVKNGSVFNNIETGKQYVLTSSKDTDANGTILTVTFDLPEETKAGEYDVSFIFRAAYNSGEEFVTFTVVPGSVICSDSILLGDLNADGEITAVDANLLKKAIMGTVSLDNKAIKAADVNNDTFITAIDANYMTKYISGAITEFPR